MGSHTRILAATVALLSVPVAAQQPVLLSDINAAGVNADSKPRDMVVFNGRMYFSADHPATGRELYSTSGTVGDVTLVADVQPGAGSSYPVSLTVAGNKLFFIADDGVGRRVWVTDGAVTSLATNISGVRLLVPVGDRMLLVQAASFGEDAYWVTDGTPGGTVKILEGVHGGWDALAFGSDAVFWHDDGLHGMELWKTDGSAEGTAMITEIRPGTNSARIAGAYSEWVVAGQTVFFAASDGTHGVELWATDGTAEGTWLVVDLFPGSNESFPTEFAALGSRVVFSARSSFGASGTYVSDGTRAGTRFLADVRIGTGNSTETAGAAIGSLYVFAARDTNGNYHPWVTDGTPGGTRQISGLSRSNGFTAIASEVFFDAESVTTGPALWKTDGTSAGTVLVANLVPENAFIGDLHDLAALGDKLIFGGEHWAYGDEPFVSDGTAGGTELLADIWPAATTANSDPVEFVDIDGTMYFRARDDLTGNELWKTDGTPAGTQMVVELISGSASGLPTSITNGFQAQMLRVGDDLFFSGRDATTGDMELFKTDGTAAGTSLVLDIDDPTQGSFPAMLGTIDDKLLFAATSSAEGRELWISDGTEAGTQIVADLGLGSVGINPSGGLVVDEVLYFGASGNLWRSDGTAAGTSPLTQFSGFPGFPLPDPIDLVQLGDELYFGAQGFFQGNELWKTDGTPGGTEMVLEINPGLGNGIVAGELVRSGDSLFFIATPGTSGAELRKSDGTAAGMVTLASVSGVGYDLTPLNGGVLFASTDSGGSEPWFSDGTVAGTGRIADLVPGPGGSNPSDFVATGSRAYFSATTMTGEVGLYRTDGTAAGTQLVATFASIGLLGLSQPRHTLLSDGRFLFVADDGTTGDELWAIEAGASVQYLGDGCSQDGFPPLLDASDAQLGGTLRFDLYSAEASAGGAIWLGLPTGQTYLGLGRNCHFYFPLSQIVVLTPLVPDPTGRATFSMPVVDHPGLVGVQIHAQAVQWYAINSWGLDSSNGVKLTLGR